MEVASINFNQLNAGIFSFVAPCPMSTRYIATK